MHVGEQCMAVWARRLVAVHGRQLFALGRSVGPIFRVEQLEVMVEILGTAKELVAQTAPGSQVLTCCFFTSHVVPVPCANNGEDPVSPFLALEVL